MAGPVYPYRDRRCDHLVARYGEAYVAHVKALIAAGYVQVIAHNRFEQNLADKMTALLPRMAKESLDGPA